MSALGKANGHTDLLTIPPAAIESNTSYVSLDGSEIPAEGEVMAPRKPTPEELWYKRVKFAGWVFGAVVMLAFGAGGWIKGITSDNAALGRRVEALEGAKQNELIQVLQAITQAQQAENNKLDTIIQMERRGNGRTRYVQVPVSPIKPQGFAGGIKNPPQARP